jgi:hypothetical protein
MALVDPSDPTYNWACYAHDVDVYIMTNYPVKYASLNFDTHYSPQYWLMGDWLRGSGAVTSSDDLATMRAFYSWLAKTAFYTGGSYPTPSNAYNSPGMFHGSTSNGTINASGPLDLYNMRNFGGNNYSLARFLILTEVGLMFNDNTTDAPNIPTGTWNTCGATRYQVCNDGTAGSLIAYWNYVKGATLYDYWAHIEDPNVTWQAYQAAYGNLPTQPQCENTDLLMHPCFGDSRDGGSSEGAWYQTSMSYPRWALNIMHTAGVDDPIANGPQISAVSSSWWDMKYIHDLEYLAGTNNELWDSTNGIFKTEPVYNSLMYGDMYHYSHVASDAWVDAATLTFDSYTGRTDRANALKWINFNYAYGGPLGNLYGCTTYCGYDNNLQSTGLSGQSAFDMFISQPAGDPVSGTLPSDPRPSLPLDFFDGSLNQNIVSRTSWLSSGTLFSAWFNNALINHEYNVDGRFDVFSNGEYITKGRTEFNNYDHYMSTTINQNTMSLLNSTGTCAGTFPPTSDLCPFYQFIQLGGQLPQSQQAGLVTPNHSEFATYTAINGNTTNAYNGEAANGAYGAYNDVTSASRSIVYLKGSNQVVFYDRAAVAHAGSTQSLTQVTTGSPTISGNSASWLTRSSTQKAYFTSLLPSGGTVSNIGLMCPGNYQGSPDPQCNAPLQEQDWEPAAILQVTPPGTPTSTQFLSTLTWGPASLANPNPTLVQSSGGQGFDGALVGSSLVMFMRTWPATFTTLTYPASGATTHYISDLTPNTTYTISGAGAPNTATADTAGVLTFNAAGTGIITVRSAAKIPPTAKGANTAPRTALYAAGTVAVVTVLAVCAERMRSTRATQIERTAPCTGTCES